MFIAETAVIFLLLIFIAFKGTKAADKTDFRYLDMDETIPLRGLLAICIVLHHGSAGYQTISFLAPFRFIGFLVVALFFFLNGYGLRSGLNQKTAYMEGFLKKRLTKILIPYWIADVLSFVVNVTLGAEYSLKDILLSISLIKVLNPFCWYIQELVIFYLMFYVAYRKERKDWLFALLFIGACLVAISSGIDDLYYRSALAFPLGMFWQEKKQTMDKWMEKRYFPKVFFLGAFLMLCFFFKYLGYRWNLTWLFQCGNLFSSVVFCVLAWWILKEWRPSNQLLIFFGKISYEVYLFHYCALRIAWKMSFVTSHPLLFFTVVFTITISMAVSLKAAVSGGNCIVKKINEGRKL